MDLCYFVVCLICPRIARYMDMNLRYEASGCGNKFIIGTCCVTVGNLSPGECENCLSLIAAGLDFSVPN